MKPLSFRLKIALLSAFISGLVLAGFWAGTWLLVSQQRLESVDREIRALSARHPGSGGANRGSFDRFTSSLESIFGEDRKDSVALVVFDAANVVQYRSPHWPTNWGAAQLPLPLEDDPKAPVARADATNAAHTGPPWSGGSGGGRGMGSGMGSGMGAGRGMGPGRGMGQMTFTKIPKYLTVTQNDSLWRFGVFGNAETTLAIGINYDEVQGDLRRLGWVFLMTLPLALFFVGLGGWLVARRALRPMKVIADTAERVTASGLDRRIPVSNEDPEIARVVQVLNRMMDRLETSFRQANRFSADASHELKTPLAIMQGELENALQAAPPGSHEQQVFGNLLEETQRLKSITRSLLLLAQADAGQLKLTRESVDLSAMTANLVEDAQILAGEMQLAFDIEIPPGVTVQADRTLLHTAMMNLLANAVKYSESPGRVAVKLASNAGVVRLEIGNTGGGIAPDEREKIFERFHRVDATRGRSVDGVGLGLGLAREIIRAHGGELTLKESRPGWTSFEMLLK